MSRGLTFYFQIKKGLIISKKKTIMLYYRVLYGFSALEVL